MRRILLGGTIVAAAVLLVAVFRTSATRGADRPGGPEVVKVVRRDVGSVVKATGVVKPMIGAQVRVGSRVSGVVKHLRVRVGDVVRKGQLLAELDARELVAQRDQAMAALQSSQANLRYAEADLDRKRRLEGARLLAPSELDLAERAHTVAERQAAQARASLEYAGTQADYSRIHAPIAGIVASVSTQEGETVAASFAAPTFVTLLDLDRLEVWAYVDETDIGRIEIGQEARFTVDTYPDHEFEGRITDIYPQAEIRDNVVNYVTVVRFDPPRDRTLRPEMTTTVRIALEKRANVLALPRRAVRREGGRQFVFAPRGDSVVRREVVTGTRDEGYFEIASGLQEGDEVLLGDVKAETTEEMRGSHP
jgi:RND family efflux transporter MFP subunit